MTDLDAAMQPQAGFSLLEELRAVAGSPGWMIRPLPSPCCLPCKWHSP
jgi:hypothetical protein